MKDIERDDMVTIKPEYVHEKDVFDYKIVPGYYYPVVSADDEVVDIQTDEAGILQKKKFQVELDGDHEFIVCWVDKKENQIFAKYHSREYMMEYLESVKNMALSGDHINVFRSSADIKEVFLQK